ncbi:phosphatidate cytidylyltransferase [Paracoccus shanxieyensis]|uniref:Phosphatidate cytidylyltransferase n=1 Tax=Paracoccus shanxieyensis TaxID=2675752 RepID=A0A6L6IW66_9RHOB|nr:phosphatidate cytidylyltransferase [Paracoccus shanxieyensis]MTH64746.1 phosphatidate cytidylyltransferase [Paracoccus shanxieyensis]MTH88021.1 phosphatidate cytidylyltransferase [Paracoccus shanxieyensis]
MTGPQLPRKRFRDKLKPGKWADLRKRFGWGALLLVLGVILLLSSGLWMRLGVSVIAGLMMWELARLTGWRHPEFHSPRHPVLIGCLSALVLLTMLMIPGDLPLLLIVVPILAGLPGTHSHERLAYVTFTISILGAAYALVAMREVMGLATVFWIVATVVQSDVLGYFVGRKLGGRKFWPSISPKKTWSGTLAGWAGAFVLALGLLATGEAPWSVLLIGPALAIAGQFGDIAESWLKRRVGAKDSSALIPGHGGVMDRFDAMTGALLLALLLMLVHLLPVIGD